ncbi:MAG: glycerol acyltransferase [Chlorobi bacterium]|nr:glycerol acyltransferase [Chlorobiota bacterium]
MQKFNFEDIRSYRDNEVHHKLLELLKDEEFIYILKKIYPDERIERLSRELSRVNSVYDFQKKYISEYITALLQLTVSSLKVEGFENIEKNKPYLFISNHRDIISDPALINYLFLQNGYDTCESGVGNNLLIYRWIEILIRLNKSFIVRRDLKGKAMFEGSHKLSAYIRDTIINRKNSVWIAQREGRTKDGNDKTDPAILKMFGMSGTGNFIDDFRELNIIPVSISYENEPAIESKVAATYAKISGEKYTKTPEEDLADMGRGLYGMKGEINIVFGKPVNGKLQSIGKIKKKNEKFAELARRIDEQIYENYKLTKPNYIAFDILTGSKKFMKEGKYTKAEETKMILLCEKTVSSLKGNQNLLEKIYYGIYANPLINKIKI